MGVKDEFHQKAILVCIDELCQRSTSKESELLVVTASNDGDPSSHTGLTPPHRMVESSFQSLERCDKCHKFLRGLLHQGLICHCKFNWFWVALIGFEKEKSLISFLFLKYLKLVDWLHIVLVRQLDYPLVFKDYRCAPTGFIIEQVCFSPGHFPWTFLYFRLLIGFFLVQFLE